jgi:hypothetical protein
VIDVMMLNILDTGTDCGFCPPLLLGEGRGEGFQKTQIVTVHNIVKI